MSFSKNQKNRSIKQKRKEKPIVLIAFEDKKSSKYYFRKLLNANGLSGKVILVDIDKGQDPKSVIEKLEKHKKDNPKDIFEYEWIVIDRDDWSKDKYLGTIEKARQKNICVAFANDAYELWILLHFEPVTRYTHRNILNSRLNKIFQNKFGKKYDKSSRDVYKNIIEYQNKAIKNTKKLISQNIKDNGRINPQNNPLTTIYQLVECLNNINSPEKKEFCKCFPQKTD